jgi:hypothetical protein
METTWSFAARPIPGMKVLAALLGAAALAAIYPVAATIATAMATSFRMDDAQPAAPMAVFTAATERNSLGLRSVRRSALAAAAPL